MEKILKVRKATIAFFLTFGFLLFSVMITAQTWPWAKAGTGTGTDAGHAVASDAAGNVYATGYFNSATITFGGVTLTNSSGGVSDLFLVKYDASGNVMWATNPAGAGRDEAFGITTDALGNVYVTGTYGSGGITFGTYTLPPPPASGANVFLVKYDPAGTVLWAQSGVITGGGGWGTGMSVSVDRSSGACYASGRFAGTNITFGSTTLNSTSTDNAFLVKYDATGNALWAVTTVGASFDYNNGYGVTVDQASGNVYMTGYFNSPSLTIGSVILTSFGSYDIFLVKYDGSGSVLWAKNVGGTNSDFGNGVATDVCGNVYVSGYFRSPTIIFGGTTLTNTISGKGDAFLAKYDATGNVIWAKSGIGADSETISTVTTDPSGNIYVAGTFSLFGSSSITFGSITLPFPAGSFNPLYIVKYDFNGNVLCASGLATGGDYWTGTTGIVANSAGDAFITGGFQTVNPFVVGGTSMARTGQQNVYVAKYRCASTFTLTASQTNAGCQCTGMATVNAIGCSNYSYAWSPAAGGQTTQTITGLCSGGYTVTVTDGSGITATTIINITQSTTTLTTSTTTTQAGCNSANGSASVMASGGVGTLIYSWSNGSTSATATNLLAGNYTVTVTDAMSCSATTTVVLVSAQSMTASFVKGTSGCVGCGCKEWVMVTATGGNSPYIYLWDDGYGKRYKNQLCPGTYKISITDKNGCSINVNVATP